MNITTYAARACELMSMKVQNNLMYINMNYQHCYIKKINT